MTRPSKHAPGSEIDADRLTVPDSSSRCARTLTFQFDRALTTTIRSRLNGHSGAQGGSPQEWTEFDIDIVPIINRNRISLQDHFKATVVRGSEKAPDLIIPPWCRLPEAIAVVAGRRYYENIVKPTVADVQYEYLEAMQRGDDRRASGIKWFGLLRIVLAAAICPITRLWRQLASRGA